MADPHNIKRYGETWNLERIQQYLFELEFVKRWVVISGGWAWHFMSPKGHVEYKHAHDHKDADIFVHPEFTGIAVGMLKQRGFVKTRTQHDTKEQKFIRYEKYLDDYKITFDVFFQEVPYTYISDWKIIEINYLLSLYKNVHSSDNCWAVKAASKLIELGIDPLFNKNLIQEIK